MPVNRNALIRYRTIDSCLRNRYREWTLEDLIDACSDALYEYEGIDKGVSRRTIQADLETMRSGKLGYEAPIVVTNRKYYTYSNKDFTITNIPLDAQDLLVLSEASSLLKQFKGLPHSADLNEMITKLEDKIHSQKTQTMPVVDFERNEHLRGLHWIDALRRYIVDKRPVMITYKSFRARNPSTYAFSPYLLKEYRNRWFVLGTAHKRGTPLFTLALDRIENLEDPEGEDVVYKKNDHVDFANHFNDMIGVTRDLKSKPSTVVFRMNRADAPYIITKPLHPSQNLLREEEDHLLFSIHVILNFELERELLGFGAAIEVLSPRILRKRIMDVLQRANEKYVTASKEKR